MKFIKNKKKTLALYNMYSYNDVRLSVQVGIIKGNEVQDV